MLRLTLASLRLHRRRYSAAVLAIVLGVGFCAATLAVSAASKKGLGDALVAQYAAADVVARSDRGAVRPDLADEVANQPGVAAATVVQSGYALISWPGESAPSYQEIDDIASNSDLRWQHLDSGHFPTNADQIAVDAGAAAHRHIGLGDTVTINAAKGSVQQVEVVGLTRAVKSGTIGSVYVKQGTLDAWRVPQPSSELIVKATSGVSPDGVAAEINALGGVRAVTTDAIRAAATSTLTDGIDLLGLFLQAFAVISLFVSALVIANTFTIVVAQRTRDLALMRCVGAERRQIFWAVVGEALALGVGAAVVGTVAGLSLAALAITILNGTAIPVPLVLGMPSALTLLGPIAAGVFVTVVAAIGPARRATRVAPLAALRPDESNGASIGGRVGLVRLALGVSLVGFGWLVIAMAVRGSGLLVGVAGGSISFMGVLVLAPAVVPSSIGGIGLVRRVLPRRLRGGVPVELAVSNANRNPRRTSATTAALLVGVTLISVLTVGASSMSASADQAADHNNPVDLTVSAVNPAGLPSGLAKELGSIDGVTESVGLPGLTAKAHGTTVEVASIDAGDAAAVLRDRSLVAALGRGKALIPSNYSGVVFINRHNRLTLTAGGKQVEVPIEYASIDGGPIVIPADDLAALGGATGIAGIWLQASDTADPQSVVGDVQDKVAADAGAHAPPPVGGEYLERATIHNALDVMLLISTGLLAMAVIIALVGVSNTLSLSVIERSREQALLRALGLTRGQLRATLASEAVLMSVVAAIGGVGLGIVYGWAGTLTVMRQVTSQDVVLAIPWARLAVIVTVACLAGLAASLLPARRAMKIAPASMQDMSAV